MQVSPIVIASMLMFTTSAGAVLSSGESALVGGLRESTVRRALAELESGHLRFPDRAKGSSGEVSRFQILPSIWRQYSRSRRYTDPGEAWKVARQILYERQQLFVEATGRLPSPFELYLLWNKPGLYESVEFDAARLPSKLTNRASRFQNLTLVNR